MSSSRNKVVKIYYHRFEIEETFKDTKHVFEFDHVRLTKPNSLKVLLWCIFLGIALLYTVTKPTKQLNRGTNPKKHISWVRRAYEQFERVLVSYRGLTGLTPRYRDRASGLKCTWVRTILLTYSSHRGKVWIIKINMRETGAFSFR